MKVLAKLNMQLGECPRWNVIEQNWYWVDISGQVFYRYITATEKLEQRELNFQPACFAFTEENAIILTSSQGIYRLDDFHGELDLIANPEQHIPDNRFNDGTPTPEGDFIIGSIGNGKEPDGTTYRLAKTNSTYSTKIIEENFTIINGQAFSPCGNFYYLTDTPTQVIYRQSYDKTSNSLGPKEVFYRCKPDEYPDGAAVDIDGNYWVAMYGSSKISIITPEGNKLKDIKLPASQPTMVAFGGENLNQLLVTTAAQWLPEDQKIKEPDAGSVFIMDTEIVGTLPTKLLG